jgi:glycosyltransferase involved in cell wall biosynthesis
MDRMGIDFQVALLGENYQARPKAFVAAKSRFGEKIVQYGFVESKDAYLAWLKRGAVVVSTANQENFGISVVEAIRHGCLPLLPDRLSYPEILPEEFHEAFLYRDEDDLVENWRRSCGIRTVSPVTGGAFRDDGPPCLAVGD